MATKASLVIDAAAYFELMREAMLKARQSIFMIGWDFDTRIHLALVTDDRAGMAEALAPAFGLSPADALASPHALCGNVDEIVDDLLEMREHLGIASIGLSLDAIDSFAPIVARLADA